MGASSVLRKTINNCTTLVIPFYWVAYNASGTYRELMYGKGSDGRRSSSYDMLDPIHHKSKGFITSARGEICSEIPRGGREYLRRRESSGDGRSQNSWFYYETAFTCVRLGRVLFTQNCNQLAVFKKSCDFSVSSRFSAARRDMWTFAWSWKDALWLLLQMKIWNTLTVGILSIQESSSGCMDFCSGCWIHLFLNRRKGDGIR